MFRRVSRNIGVIYILSIAKRSPIVFVPLSRMPLNPNGKIDKPALPFPDTVQAASAETRHIEPSSSTGEGTSTEEIMRGIWAGILPNAPSPLPLDESFFDLGGHSILATRLIFEVRKVFAVSAPLGLVFDHPTIGGLVAAVNVLRSGDMGLAYNNIHLPEASSALELEAPGIHGPKNTSTQIVYAQDYVNLLPRLQDSYPAPPSDISTGPLTVFLTGATGFLGAFVLHDLLSRRNDVKKVICLVRAPDNEQGIRRLRQGSADRDVWNEDWVKSQRLEVLTGDLSQELFGLGQDQWARVAKEADVVLHNGALVLDLFLLWSKDKAKYRTGPLGLSIRKASSCECTRDSHCCRACFEHQTKSPRFRFVDIGY